jgi:hypothetical protein
MPNPPGPPGPTANPTAVPAHTSAPATSPCTHTSSNPTWFEEQAGHLKWAVYCAVLPSGWSIESGSADYNGDGLLVVNYKRSGGGTLQAKEMGTPSGIKLLGTDIGTVKVGDMNGILYDEGGGQVAAWVSAGTSGVSGAGYYYIRGSGMSAMQFSDLVNAMRRVSGS